MSDVDKRRDTIQHLQNLIDAYKCDDIAIESISVETKPVPGEYNGVNITFDPSHVFVEKIVYIVRGKNA